MRTVLPLAAALVGLSLPAAAQTVREASVRGHVSYLAGPALKGRASASPDEAAAAHYVAAMLRGYGLKPAPGMDGYVQQAEVVSLAMAGTPTLSIAGAPVAQPLLFASSGQSLSGTLTVFAGSDPAQAPAADILILTDPKVDGLRFAFEADPAKTRLVFVRATERLRGFYAQIGNAPRLPRGFKGAAMPPRISVVALDDAAFAQVAGQAGAAVALTVPVAERTSVTSNAVGFLPGTDPTAGVLLVSAHLDHLGQRPDGKIMYGANDDASGTTAVLELAQALSTRRHRRGILFVAYGSEEAGGFGAQHFLKNLPVPLESIVANLEIEMIGQQDAKLPAGTMMMTGYERSTFGPLLKAQGALVAPDPYPEQNFFQRSDNYALARAGVVAHTVSGWATVPTYHTPEDTVERLDLPFMTRAIQSLVKPLARLADSRERPSWNPGGKPTE
jgi:aminopeptidase YwaD